MSPPEATLDDDVVSEILLRLPSASVFRSRAVCKAWHRITTDPSFLAAHADRQPAELLVLSRHSQDRDRYVLDAVPLSLQVDETRRVRDLLHCHEHSYALFLAGSCHGLLLVEKCPPGPCYSDYFVCNPVTRRGAWLDLQPPACRGNLVLLCAFYRHRPSSEHRLLVLANETGSAAHYVFSLGAAEEAPRRLGPVADQVVVQFITLIPMNCVDHRGKLHWMTHPQAVKQKKILAFDVLSEAFRLMSRPPRSADHLCLVEMDGMLAATAILSDSMDLWVRQDCDDDESWSHRVRIESCGFRVELRPLLDACWSMGTGVPDVILVGSYMSRFVGLYHLTEKRIIKQIDFVSCRMDTTTGYFVYKESLLPHAFSDRS